MRETDFQQDDLGLVKSHEEILQLIDEIKEIENNFDEIEVGEPLLQEWKTVASEEAKPIPIKSEVEESKEKKRSRFRLRKRSRLEVKRIEREKRYATFKFRFDDDGNLVNLDFRKPKPKPEKAKEKFKIPIINKFIRKGKEKAEPTEETPNEEKKGIGGKIKGALGGIGKIKNAIPGRKKKTEEAPKEKTEEE